MDRPTGDDQSIITYCVEVIVVLFKKDIYIGYVLVTNLAERTLISLMVNSHSETNVNWWISLKQVALDMYLLMLSFYYARITIGDID